MVLKSSRNPRHLAREVARSHSSCILSFDLIGLHQNKRFYVTEIVLPLGFADAIFWRERSDDRKCVCCSQAMFTPTPSPQNQCCILALNKSLSFTSDIIDSEAPVLTDTRVNYFCP